MEKTIKELLAGSLTDYSDVLSVYAARDDYDQATMKRAINELKGKMMDDDDCGTPNEIGTLPVGTLPIGTVTDDVDLEALEEKTLTSNLISLKSIQLSTRLIGVTRQITDEKDANKKLSLIGDALLIVGILSALSVAKDGRGVNKILALIGGLS